MKSFIRQKGFEIAVFESLGGQRCGKLHEMLTLYLTKWSYGRIQEIGAPERVEKPDYDRDRCYDDNDLADRIGHRYVSNYQIHKKPEEGQVE
jgi:hypothetical protein